MFYLVQIINYLFQQPMRSHGIAMWLCLQFTVWDIFIQTTENGHFAAPKTLNILAKKANNIDSCLSRNNAWLTSTLGP